MSDGTQIGLVGFFDILGYQNLLERNEPEQIADEVLPILLGIRDKATSRITERYHALVSSEKSRKRLASVLDSMELLSFSDTILITLPTDPDNSKNQHFEWLAFLVTAVAVQKQLFEAGLPARGAIEFGKFFIKDTCFAGRTIVNAYQLSAQIEMSACVLSESAAKEVRRIEEIEGVGAFDSALLNYLVPLKGGERHMPVLKCIPKGLDASNVRSTVMQAFWGNGKDISQSVRSKIINTEQWLEFLLSRRKKPDSSMS